MKESLDKLVEKFGDAILATESFRGDEVCVVKRENLLDVCKYLRSELKFDMMSDLCGADYPGRSERFEVVYHLYSVDAGKRLRLKVRLPQENLLVASVSGIWKAADWFEREAYDLFGIKFEGHPNLKRILCYNEFVGHALRKDYPKNRRGVIPTPDTLL
jgi:NADH-quinone oxidoreductase subunit C